MSFRLEASTHFSGVTEIKTTNLKIFLQPFIHVNWLQDSIVYKEKILCTDGNDMKRSHIKATKINNQVKNMIFFILYVSFIYKNVFRG